MRVVRYTFIDSPKYLRMINESEKYRRIRGIGSRPKSEGITGGRTDGLSLLLRRV